MKKVVPNGETTIFVYDAGAKLIAEYSTVVAPVQDAKVAYLTADHLGSPRINTDANGNVTARHDYHPFGEEISTAQRTTGLGYDGDTIRKQFTGYERDNEIDLDFAQARYYGYNHGRFTSPDPYKIVAEVQYERDEQKARAMLNRYLSQPQQLNRYPYAINNPLKYIDPSGEIIWLTGNEEERKAALQRIRNTLGEERFALVKVDADGRRLSLSNENVAKMQKIGDDDLNKEFSTGMAEMLNSSAVVEFSVTEKFTNVNGYEIDLNTRTYAGGLTVSGKDSSSGNIQIFVHPRAGEIVTQEAKNRGGLKDKTSDGNALTVTNEMVDAHEFGHAWDRMRSQGTPAMSGGRLREAGWQVFENAIRSRNPSNPQRRTKH
ncbi:MAG: RHS repeat domain-containing protein [Pyrinomonadaceae bacterium]